MKFAELKTKEIVRLSDGKKLGYADDLVINEETNEVVALRVPKSSRGFRKPEYFEIQFSNITKIGENVILVNADKETICFDDYQDQQKNEYIFSPRIFRRSDNKNKK